MNSPQTPTTNPLTSDPLPEPSGYNSHAGLSSTEALKMVGWAKEDLAAGRIDQARYDATMDQLGVPMDQRSIKLPAHRDAGDPKVWKDVFGRLGMPETADNRSAEQQQLDAAFPAREKSRQYHSIRSPWLGFAAGCRTTAKSEAVRHNRKSLVKSCGLRTRARERPGECDWPSGRDDERDE